MKKLITLALAAIFTLSVFVPVFAGQKVAIKDQDQIKLVVFKIGDSNYYVEDKDGNIQTVPMDVAPYIKDGRTLVPARFLGNALGVPDEKITWNQATRTATLQGKKKLTLVIGSLNMKSDDEAVKMDVAPEIKSGRTMLLARYVAEGLGYEVGWDAVRKLVICWEEGTPQPDMSKILKEIEAEVITMGKGNTRISIRNVEGDARRVFGNEAEQPKNKETRKIRRSDSEAVQELQVRHIGNVSLLECLIQVVPAPRKIKAFHVTSGFFGLVQRSHLHK
jgi:hypothetical protein